jgi:hypothetical protein
VIPARIVALLTIVFVGSIVAEELFRFLTSILLLLIILTAAMLIGWGVLRVIRDTGH